MIKNLLSKDKARTAKTIVFALFLIAMFIVFMFFKHRNDFAVSLADALMIGACFFISVALMFFRPEIPDFFRWLFEAFLIIGVPVILFRSLESLVGDPDSLSLGTSFINIAIIFCVTLFFYGLTQNAGIAVGISGLITYIFYLIEYFTVHFRGTPVIFNDFLSYKTTIGVMGSYQYVLKSDMMVIFFLIALFYSFGLYINDNKKKIKVRLLICVLSLLISTSTIVFFIRSDFLYDCGITASDFHPISAVNSNGLLANSFISLKENIDDDPDIYEAQEVEEIISDYISESAEEEEELLKPNIIVIMNESFTDLDYLETVELTEDPIPNFRSMSDNCIKGTLISSIYGGSTPNSEFEFLTGCSLAFLPQGVITYQTEINSSLPTFATHLKKYGYENIAVHLFDPEYFERDRVYPLFGFDGFISQENPNVEIEIIENKEEYVMGDYATDKSSFEAIKKVTSENDGGDPLFIFCVTVQNHGGYWHWFRDILVTNANSDYANDYASLIHITDNDYKELIDYYSDVEEPTIIVMYGDHQPNLFEDFYDTIWEECDYTDDEKRYMKAKVPFVIWANYDIEEAVYDEISINYLGPLVMKTAGIPLSGYFSYIDEMREQVPVICSLGFVDSEGNHFTDYEDSAYYEEINQYRLLQYKFLKGNPWNQFYD